MERSASTWANPSWWNLLIVLPWAIAAILCIHEWNVDRDIATREQTTEGVITSHEPTNHNRYGYIFHVGGKTFTGWQSPMKDEFEIGKPVTVYYDPKDPSKNALTEFRDLGTIRFGPVPTVLLGIGTVAWFIRSQRKKKSN